MRSFEESIDFLCRSLIHPIKGSKPPAWTTLDKTEGIEFKNGKLRSFRIIYDRRIYCKPASENIQAIIDVMQREKKCDNFFTRHQTIK